MDTGEERVDDENLVERLQSKATGINRRALITAVAITLATLVFP